MQWGRRAALVWTNPRPLLTGRATGVLLELDVAASLPNPRRMLLRARPIDDRLVDLVEREGSAGVALRWQGDARAAGRTDDGELREPVWIDLFSGRIESGVPGVEITSIVAGRLRDALDGELLDALWAGSLRARGNDPDAVTSCVRDSPDWEPGSLASWQTAAAWARPDVYPPDARDPWSTLAEEVFCPMPRCDCREAVVMFRNVSTSLKPVGSEFSG